MVSLPDSNAELFALFKDQIEGQPVLSSTDLGRVSIERHAGHHELARTAPSAGAMRLTGPGVDGHEASLEDVSLMGSALQKLVSSVGASLRGFKAIRGRIPSDISNKTVLGLRAAPRQGSIILDLAPKVDPISELRRRGEIINETDSQLVDEVMTSLGVLMHAATEQESGLTERFSAEVRELGPRVASALKVFAQVTSGSRFNMEFTWAQPLHATVDFSLSSRDAVWIARLISGQKLDAEDVQVHGVLRTVSHGQKWELLDSEFGKVGIDVSDLGGRPWAEWNPDDLVEIDASMTITQAPGRAPSRSLKARNIRTWEGSLNDIVRADDDPELEV
ncbi:hypothetical protein [Arthrobacter silvisoli]|uniref:hypothetical protein n=1 Tax=Arthrobacter silvisoli TaxID=2291022 RepID=UPI00109BF201|nr:hypothetical protein [Arthrobacter silvisoli]